MADYLMGLDYGTGGAKACIIDSSGQVLSYEFMEYPIYHDKPGWSEHDPDRYWTVACDLIRKAVAEAHVNAAEIRGIAVSSALPSLVMVDKDWNPVERGYNLMDRRATREVDWLKETIGEQKLMRVNPNRLDDHPSVVNLLWEKNNRPESFKRVHKALTMDGYVALKLTGRPVVNFPAAPFCGPGYNLVQRKFEDSVLDEVGINPSLMPELVDCEEVMGKVTPAAAEATGLAAGTPVSVQVDFNASCLAAGIIDEGDTMSNLGTVGNFGVVHKSTDFMYSEVGLSMINLAFTINSADTFITIPSTTTGGQSLRYIRDNFSQLEVEVERVLGVSSYDLLTLEAAKAPVGSEGLVILPFLMGERTPIWDNRARGVVFGLSLNHSKGHFVRAMMEAVAYALYDSYRLIEESGLRMNDPFVFHEGGTASVLWRQIITDVFNVPTVCVLRRTGAPFGDAILAGVVNGVLEDYSVAKQWVEYSDPLLPSQENHDVYMQFFKLYKQIYEHVKGDFRELARLREELY
jgi:sugar (pentulose or hexulose) kinase